MSCVCGGFSVLCQLHDNLSMCRGGFLNLDVYTSLPRMSFFKNNVKLWVIIPFRQCDPTKKYQKTRINIIWNICIYAFIKLSSGLWFWITRQGTKLRSRTASGVISQVPVALASHVSVSPVVCGAAPGILLRRKHKEMPRDLLFTF